MSGLASLTSTEPSWVSLNLHGEQPVVRDNWKLNRRFLTTDSLRRNALAHTERGEGVELDEKVLQASGDC